MPSKPWYESKTVWLGLALVALVVGYLATDKIPLDTFMALATGLAGAMGITLRMGAGKAIAPNAKVAALGLCGLLAASPAHADWQAVEFRGQVNLVEVVAPFFGAAGRVQASPSLMLGIGWRQSDDDPESEDGHKPLGAYLGVAFVATDPFDFNWLQIQGGITYEEALSLGVGAWVGNRTELRVDPESGDEVEYVVPGLSARALLPIVGVGVQADP